MSATTYEQTTASRHAGTREFGHAVLNWLARIGERSPQGRAAAMHQRLNALSDAELARMDIKRSDLLERCYGWRAYY